MKYVAPQSASDWLRSHGIIESPYSIKPSPIPCKQYRVPKTSSPVNTLVGQLIETKRGLLVFHDWTFYHPDDWRHYKSHQLSFVEKIKNATSQSPELNVGIAFIYEATEHAKLISHVDISLELGWSLYLYSETAIATIYFWEGELIDVWSNSKKFFATADRLLT